MGIVSLSLAGCSKRPSSKAAASEEGRRTLRYVEPLSDARTMLADFFSIRLGRLPHGPREVPSVIVAPLSLYVAPMGFGQSSIAVTLNQQGQMRDR